MPESIRDGAGSGYMAGVNKEFRLMVSGPSVSQEHYTNFVYKDAYSMLFDVTPTGAGDTFLYVQNTSPKPIVCEGFSIHCPTNEGIDVCLGGIGTSIVGGTDVIPGNLSSGSANSAVGVFQVGADITGISGETNVLHYGIAASYNSDYRNFNADVVIPQNKTLCMKAVVGGILLHGFVIMWHDHEGGKY